MSKITRKEKLEIVLGSAIAAMSVADGITLEGEDDFKGESREDVLVALNELFVTTANMYISEYLIDGDTSIDDGNEYLATAATKTLNMAINRVKAKNKPEPEDKTGIMAMSESELVDIIGQEAFDKLAAKVL
ncbi:MAG: hypothetical protein DRJ64_04495 [Thermoprotei archaeon]|nr:MAG: hypothetical protein DRJ64_04495 [Thermoprotei archaeon]